MKPHCCIALVICGVAWSALAQLPVLPSDVSARIQGRITNCYCPAYVVALINSNGVSYFSFGCPSWDSTAAVNADSVFEIGSVTKTFTCTLLSDQVLKGQMALSDSVQQYLPGSVHVPTRSGKVITLQHLATHTSGLPRLPDNLNPTNWNNPYIDYTTQNLYDFLSGYTLPRDPGSAWEYSNLGMGLLGHVLTLRTGQDYESLVVQRICQVLNMPDTRITLSASMRSRLAGGFCGVVPLQNWDFDVLAPCGALRSTARDLSSYVRANLGLLSSSLFPAMTNAHKLRYADSQVNMGLGWFLGQTTTGPIVWHDGATGGYSSFVGFLPGQGKGAVVLANGYLDIAETIGLHLLEPAVSLGSDPVPVSVPLATLQRYVGRYASTNGDFFDIGLQQGHLTCAYSGDISAYTLYASSTQSFFLNVVTASATFVTNSSGRTSAMQWTQNGQTFEYPRTFVPSRLAIQFQNGKALLRLTGDGDLNYVIEASSDFLSWTPISTNTVWTSPVADNTSGSLSPRFYRLRN